MASLLGAKFESTQGLRRNLKFFITVAIIAAIEMNFHPIEATGKAADIGGITWVKTVFEDFSFSKIHPIFEKNSSATSKVAVGGTHTVKKGDTLYSIARKNGVDLDLLLFANQLTKKSVIRPGDNLVIPGK